MIGLPSRRFSIVYADPPWPHYGDPNKDGAAGKHYPLMSMDQLAALDVKQIMDNRKDHRSVLFLWSTFPRLDLAIELIKRWGLHYRGTPYIWVKTRADGRPMGARGIPPTFVKPTCELVLAATIQPRGRPFPIKTHNQSQIVMAPVTRHSEKPAVVRKRILELCGDLPRIELFARKAVPGWACWGEGLDQ